MAKLSSSFLKASDFSLRLGFLGNIANDITLEDSYYSPWESAIRNLPRLVHEKHVREYVQLMPVLFTLRLERTSAYRRAYTVLCCLMQAFVWEGKQQLELVSSS
jgi:hypothetical protein